MAFDAEARKAELQGIYDDGDGGNWAPIKAIAEGLGVTKPDDGWEAAIDLIVEAEQTAAEGDNPEPEAPEQLVNDQPPEPPAQKATQPPPEITPWRKPRTDLHGHLIPDPWQS
ncbi:hypothetical protein Lepto7375DRAFT_7376 [Leptolyngbya sp. PCC 7375]|nr:hypothetical protein Lepto7375DRAFT_7376 [Leptolyngbya sp. PCC 7375]